MSVFQQIILWSKSCPSCFTENPDSASNCKNCGNGLGPADPWPR